MAKLSKLPKAPNQESYDVLGSWRLLSIGRHEGRWGYRAIYVDACNACSNSMFVCPLCTRPSESLVGVESPKLAWKDLRSRFPGAIDAFVAPRGNLVVVRDSASLRIFSATDGVPGAELRQIPLGAGETVALAQWAMGTSVARWDAVLKLE